MPLPAQVSPPQFAFSDVAPSRVVGVGIVALPVLAGQNGPELGPGAADLSDELGIDLLDVLDAAGAADPARAGEVTAVPIMEPGLANNALHLLLLVGVGSGSGDELRRAGAALARRTTGQATVATTVAAVGGDDELIAFVEGVVLGSFSFTMRRDGAPEKPVGRVVLALQAGSDRDLLDKALAYAGASWRARTLASVPSNIKTPDWLAQEIRRGADEADLDVTVWDEKRLEKERFGGVLAVGRGSANPPRFVRIDYRPKGARGEPTVVLAGKGITFDTGGLNIKPGEFMLNMKRDMTGAAVVAGVMGALADLGCRLNVTALLPIAENSIGGDAMRPGDVITQRSGRTVEVNNTDAEGRLVLADAMAYAVEEIKPDVLVDVATLTGAMKVALGLHTAGFLTNRDEIATAVEAAAVLAGEPVWRMPLAEEYEAGLASKVADCINAPTAAAGISAALFLQHFNGGLPWLHLDLAPVGDAQKDDFEYTQGPTGFGARVLLRWLVSGDIGKDES